MHGPTGFLRLASIAALASALTACLGQPEDDVGGIAEDLCTGGSVVSDVPTYSAPTGTLVTWTGTASCALASPEYAFWLSSPPGVWTLAQAYSTTNTFAWNTTGLAAGTYTVKVYAREAGSTVSRETVGGRNFVVTALDACQAATITPSTPTPANRGTVVTWSAGSTVCSSPTYQFWVQPAATGIWSIAQDWSASSTFVWDTTSVASGAYLFRAYARAAGSTSAYQSYATSGWYWVQFAPGAQITQITAGKRHSCVLRTDGSVNCWGENAHGELGNGALVESATPVIVGGLTSVTAIAAGYTHVCAIASGAVSCWGENTSGQLGNGTTTNSSTPVATGVTGAIALAAGAGHTCALLGSGGIRCWGYNSRGALGNGTVGTSTTPVTVLGVSNAVAIGAGYYQSCALLETGVVQCWGGNQYGQLGDGTTTGSLSPITVPLPADVRSIAVGSHTGCAVLFDQTARCWGNNADGQLGDGTTTNSLSPTPVSGLANVATIAEGVNHACAVLGDGTSRCWGTNTYGGLGDGSTTSSTVPVTVAGVPPTASMAAGWLHTCALLVDGTAQCWGFGTRGQLGNGFKANSVTPVVVSLP